MYSGKFTVIFHLLVTVLLIKCVTSADRDGSSKHLNITADHETLTVTELSNLFVATTPKITAKALTSHDRNEEGLDDDDDDDDAAAYSNQQQNVPSRQLSDGFNPLLQIFAAVSNALTKSVEKAALKNGAQLIGFTGNRETKGDIGGVGDNDLVTEHDGSGTTERAVELEEGRYIKGDPLNGYYDFIITEGSYKFWVVFQLATAALLIYSTLAAIYYSKVNPLTSDYDYVDYLSRSFHGRSMSEDSADVDDEWNPSESGRTYLSSLANNNWVKAASYGFQFAMDAIDKVPK